MRHSGLKSDKLLTRGFGYSHQSLGFQDLNRKRGEGGITEKKGVGRVIRDYQQC